MTHYAANHARVHASPTPPCPQGCTWPSRRGHRSVLRHVTKHLHSPRHQMPLDEAVGQGTLGLDDRHGDFARATDSYF
jgi:hypothetical protein